MKYRFYYAIVSTTIISHFILYAPYALKKNLYDGTVVGIFIALILSSINAYMTIYVYNANKNSNLLDINKLLLGKAIGGILSTISILGDLAVGFFMYRGMQEIIKKFMLPTSSIWLIAPTLFFILYISMFHTNESFLYFIGFVTIFIIFGSFVYIFLATKSFHMYYAKAAFIHSIKIPKLIGITAASFYFTGVSHLALFNKEFNKISWKGTVSVYSFLGTSVAILAVYMPAGMLGPYLMQKVMLTVMSSADTIGVELFIIERASYILLPLVFMLAASDMIIWAFVGWGLIKEAIPNKKVNFIIFSLIGAAYIFFSNILKNAEDVLNYGVIAISIALMFNYVLFGALFLITKLKEGKKT